VSCQYTKNTYLHNNLLITPENDAETADRR
jgi:hypothetical protein